jgi:predicted MFS family arabinose efflux permease
MGIAIRSWSQAILPRRSAAPARPAALPADRAGPAGDVATVAGLSLAALLGMASAMALSPLLPLMTTDLGGSVALLGQAIALLNLLAAGLGLALGPLADRIGARRMLTTGLLAAAASALVSASAPALALLVPAAAVGALSRAGIQPMAFAIAAERFEGEARRRAISWIQAGVSGATLVGLPVLAGVAAALGWRGALASLGLLALTVAALQGRVTPADPRPPAAPFRPDSLPRAYAPLLGHRPTRGMVTATLLGQVGFWATVTYLGAFLVQVHGLPVARAGAGYVAAGLGLLSGNVLASGPLGRLPLRALLIGMRVAQVPLLAGVLLARAGVGLAVGLLLLAGLLHGAGTALGMTLVVSESPAGRATTVTLNQSALTLGVALAGAAGGLLLAAGGYGLLAVGLVVPNALAALCLWQSRPRPHAVARPLGALGAGGEAEIGRRGR